MGKEDVYGLTEKKCPICGKKFVPAPQHVYKRKYGAGGRARWFCKYTCMLAWDREHPKKYTTMR